MKRRFVNRLPSRVLVAYYALRGWSVAYRIHITDGALVSDGKLPTIVVECHFIDTSPARSYYGIAATTTDAS